jgi:hypothetical protein
MRTGVIYKLVCNDINATDIYVGSTDSIRNRKTAHKSACNNVDGRKYNLPVYQYIRKNGGWDNWSLIELELFKYERKPELYARERHFIETLKAALNSLIPLRTPEEYRQDTNDHQIERHAQYRLDNKEKIRQGGIQYYQKNKAIMTEKHQCKCGGYYTNNHKSRHMNSKIHMKTMGEDIEDIA